MSMFKMENTEGAPRVKTYAETDIRAAVRNYVYTWDIGTIIEYAIEGMYEEYMDRSKPRIHIDKLMEKFGNNSVPDDGQRYAVVGWEQWSQLMAIDQFSRAEYVGENDLPFPNGVTAKRWLGFMWFAHSGLTETNGSGASGTTHRECFAYHRDAVAHAIGTDITSNMQYHNDKDSYFVLNKMQQNAVLIDAEGVFEMELKK